MINSQNRVKMKMHCEIFSFLFNITRSWLWLSTCMYTFNLTFLYSFIVRSISSSIGFYIVKWTASWDDSRHDKYVCCTIHSTTICLQCPSHMIQLCMLFVIYSLDERVNRYKEFCYRPSTITNKKHLMQLYVHCLFTKV